MCVVLIKKKGTTDKTDVCWVVGTMGGQMNNSNGEVGREIVLEGPLSSSPTCASSVVVEEKMDDLSSSSAAAASASTPSYSATGHEGNGRGGERLHEAHVHRRMKLRSYQQECCDSATGGGGGSGGNIITCLLYTSPSPRDRG